MSNFRIKLSQFVRDNFRILSFVALNARLKRDTAYQCLDMCLHVSQAQFQASRPYRVLDAKLVSSCLSWPSRASPHLSLLLARRGVKVNTLLSVKPGPTGHPSLTFEHTTSMSVNVLLRADRDLASIRETYRETYRKTRNFDTIFTNYSSLTFLTFFNIFNIQY